MVESDDPRTRFSLPASGEDAGEASLESIDFAGMSVEDLFHNLEQTVADYDDFKDCTEAHFARTLEGMKVLVKKI